MQIKNSSMAALAAENGWESMADVEVQVSSIKANGERIELSLPLSSIPSKSELRDPKEYHYEMEDDDDYFEHDDLEVRGRGWVSGGAAGGGGARDARAGAWMLRSHPFACLPACSDAR